MNAGLVLLLVVLSVSALFAVWWLARWQREKQRYNEKLPASVVPVNLIDNENAVVVAEGRGHLVFANQMARNWFGMNGGEPNLELMAESVKPSEVFLELFGKEGQASFRIGNRRVEATSHYIPHPDTARMVVVMRQLVSSGYDKRALDPVQAMNVVSEITQTISGSLKLDQTLDSILNSVSSVVAFDTAEITLWDEDLRILRPIGQSGDAEYGERLGQTDGVYHMDDSYSGWIARYRQPLLISDVKMRADVRPKIADFPYTSYIGLPLTVSERFIGTLELASRRRAQFDHEDMILLQAVAGQAAIAIENARLYQSQAERVTELSGLQQIAQAMTSLTDPRQMYSQLTSRIGGLMNVEMCGILLYDQQQQALISQAPFYGVPDAIIALYRIPILEGSAAFGIFLARDWWYTNNVRGDDMVRQVGLLNLAEAVGVRTTALVPMIVGNRRFGAVQASNKRDGSGFSENDVRLLSIFASQAAIVVENARLYDEEQRRADELGGLQQISQAIGVLRDTDELYGQINERIGKLMNVQMCGILLHNEETNVLVSQPPFYGVDEELVRYYQISVAPGSAMNALYQESEYWISNDLRVDAIVRESGLDKLAQLLGVKQTLIVPLIVAGRRLGIVQVSNKTNNTEFTEDDSRVLAIFASQAAVIIDNARLYRQMRERADEAEGLRRIAEISSGNLPLDEVIKNVVAETQKLLDCDIVGIGLLNEMNGQLTVRPEWSVGLAGLTEAFSIDAYAPDFQTSTVISKRAFLTNNVRHDGRTLPVYRAVAERFNFDAVIQAPMIIRDRGIGELTVANRGEKEFTLDDLRLVKAIANQLAAAVERSRLYAATDADLRARIQELDSLTRVSNELNLTIQLERILEVIRHEAQRTTEAEAATVVLLRPQEEWPNPQEPILDERFGSNVNLEGLAPVEREAIKQDALVAVSDYETAPLEAQPPKARSAVAAPIPYAGQIAGVVHVYSDRVDTFGTKAQDFIRALTNQAAIAVGNAIRYRQQLERSELLKQRADQLSQIFELGRTLRSQDSIEQVLEAVAHGVNDALGYKVVVLSMTDERAQAIRRVAQSGLTLDEFRTMQTTMPSLAQIEELFQPRYRISSSYFLPGEEQANWRKSNLPLVNAASAGSEQPTGTVQASQSNSQGNWTPQDLLLVPLRNPQGRLMGLMSVDDPRDSKRPTLQMVEALEIFANQAAFAIENHQLVQAFQGEADAARRERDRLAQLHLVASEIQRAADIPTRLQVVADGIRAAGWGRVAITLRDQNYEPRETITSGYSPEESALYRANLLPGIVWSQRLTDPDFRQYRVGQAYYLRYNDSWVTENKLAAGHTDSQPSSSERSDPNAPWHSEDTVYLPLYGQDRSRLIGIISMDTPADGKPPTEQSMRPIELFAVQAASAIENTRLYQETQRSAQQEARINEVMEAVSSTLDIDEIIRGVARGLQQMIAFTRMSVALLNRSETAFDVIRVTTDMRGEISVQQGAPIAPENTATGVAYRDALAKVYHLADLDRTPDYEDLKAWRESGERTSLIVPLVAGGRVLGTLHMGSELAEAFGFEDQLPLVSRMANLTAIAIENARLFQEAIDRERFSAALGRVGQSVNAMLDMESVLDTVCEESVNIMQVEGAYIWLVRGPEIVGLAARGPDSTAIVGARRQIEDDGSLGAAVVRERGALYDNSIGTPEGRYVNVLPNVPIKAMLGVPLMREDRAIGALVMAQTDPAKSFSVDDIEQAEAFAIQASIAIENARLYQETLGLQSFNDAIIQSIQQGIVVLDRNMDIRTVNAFMQRNYGWDSQAAVNKPLFEYRPGYADFLHFAIGKVLQTGQPEVQYDIQDSDDQGNRAIRNFYIYPLLERDSVSGVVLLVEDVTERSLLEADIEARAQQLSVLTEVSGRLTATLDPDSVVSLLLDQLGRILTFDNVTLWLRQGNKLVIRAARGYIDADNLVGIEAEIADSELFREIASHGQVLNIPDITQDARFPSSLDRPVRSWLGVSLVAQGNLAGLLVLEKSQIGYYTPTMEQLALTFANQAAIALENARLFQERTKAAEENTRLYRETADRAQKLDQQTQRLTLLNRVSEALAQSLDIENAFEVTLREMVLALNMDRGGAIIFEIEQQRGRLVVEYPRTPMPETIYISLEDNPLMDEMRSTGQPVTVVDARTDPRLDYIRGPLTERHILSMLIVPLTVGGQVIGSLGLDSTDGMRTFSPEQIELAMTIGSQAAIAVQNSNLFEQSVVRTRELETLFEATQSISVTLDLNNVLRNTAQQMLFALQVEKCVISYWDNVENRAIIAQEIDREDVQTHSNGAAEDGYNLGDYPARLRVLQTRQVVLVRRDDPNADPAEQQALQDHNAYGRIILPMVVREQAIGLIELESREPTRLFTTNEVRLARTLASQAAIAIDNARLQTETASKLEELFVINELSTALASSIEEEQIFKIVRSQLPALIKAQTLILAMLDEDKQTVTYPVAVREGKPLTIPTHVLGDDEISFVLKRRSAQYLAGDEMADVLRNLNITMRITSARCLLGVPMVASDQVVGALVLADETNPRAFNIDDQRVMSTVAAQLAVAIQNARLFSRTRRFTTELEQAVTQRTEELQQERDRIDFLYRITTGLTSSLDMDMVLNRALEMMALSVDADMGAILGIDNISDNLVYRATLGLPESEKDRTLAFSQHEGLAGWVVQSQQSIVVPDVQNDPRWLRMSTRDDEPRSAIAALLEANQDVLGVVTLYSNKPNHFSDAQLRLVTAAANQVASAMNNAELYGLIREQAERLGAMVRREQVDATKNAAIVESIADGVMVADQGGDIVQFNSAAERILGLPRRQVIGQHISALAGLYASSGGSRWLDAIQRWMNEPGSYRPGQDVEVRLNLDNDRFVSVILSPVNMGDQFLGTVSVFRDITREIEVDRMKSEFVATVSHELRTPMTSIKGYADLLLLGAAGQVTDQQQRFLSTIKTNADRLSILVNELLDISRVDRGVVKLNFIPTDVAEIVDTAVNHLKSRIANEKKHLNVKVNLPEDLPQVRADYDKLTQIMHNLIDNAYNYTQADGYVTVSAQREDGSVVISVADTGIGIAKEKQERIWQRFFRDDEQDLVKATSGTGLGLAIVREYVTMHNGEIWLESTPGLGSTFYVRIPVFAAE